MPIEQSQRAVETCYASRIQLVPFPLWQLNMRKLMSQGQWAKFRKALLEHDGHTCRSCGKVEAESRRLSAHEEWHYAEDAVPATAFLADVSLLCWHCHHIEHWGVTKALVAQGQLTQRAIDDTIAHFCCLNAATMAEFLTHEERATNDWERRSALKWRVDYGPFVEWVVTKFSQDPFNEEPWPEALEAQWAEALVPSASQLITTLRPEGQAPR